MIIRYLVLAGCAGCSAASAQSISLYGVADAAVEVVQATGASAGVAANRQRLVRLGSDSYLGIRGAEPLGGGTSATFQIEGNFSVDTGEFVGFDRDTFVGLESRKRGSLRLGRNSAPMLVLGESFDLTPGGNTGIGAIQSLLSINGRFTGVDDRSSNSVRYLSPEFHGTRVDLAHGAGENADASGRTDQMSGIGVTYKQGPLFVGYAYDVRNEPGQPDLAQAAGKDTRHRAGVKYELLSGLMLGGFFDKATSSAVSGAGTGEITKDAWGVIGQWERGPHALYVMFVKTRPLECSDVSSRNAVGCASAADTGARLMTLGYNYDLSKRTLIRFALSVISNERAARYDFSNSGVGAAAGADPKGVSIGLRHRF